MLGIVVIIVVIKKFVMDRKEREGEKEKKEETLLILTHRNTVGQSDRHHVIASLGQGGRLGGCSRVATGRS